MKDKNDGSEVQMPSAVPQRSILTLRNKARDAAEPREERGLMRESTKRVRLETSVLVRSGTRVFLRLYSRPDQRVEPWVVKHHRLIHAFAVAAADEGLHHLDLDIDEVTVTRLAI